MARYPVQSGIRLLKSRPDIHNKSSLSCPWTLVNSSYNRVTILMNSHANEYQTFYLVFVLAGQMAGSQATLSGGELTLLAD